MYAKNKLDWSLLIILILATVGACLPKIETLLVPLGQGKYQVFNQTNEIISTLDNVDPGLIKRVYLGEKVTKIDTVFEPVGLAGFNLNQIITRVEWVKSDTTKTVAGVENEIKIFPSRTTLAETTIPNGSAISCSLIFAILLIVILLKTSGFVEDNRALVLALVPYIVTLSSAILLVGVQGTKTLMKFPCWLSIAAFLTAILVMFLTIEFLIKKNESTLYTSNDQARFKNFIIWVTNIFSAILLIILPVYTPIMYVFLILNPFLVGWAGHEIKKIREKNQAKIEAMVKGQETI
jgi:hypothetical protein